MTIGVALIGSGIFAREQHLPAIQEASTLELKAIYSRSLKSAKSLAEGLSNVDLYSDDSGAGKSYADILKREDVGAVILALPILAQPEYIKQALSAGKHVLSEKPIAKDLATAKELVSWYGNAANVDMGKTFWGIAENYRFITKWLKTAEEVQKLGGVKTFRVLVRNFVGTEGKYFNTPWRKTPEYQGGFLLDGGIHTIAALRLILGRGPNSIKTVSAATAQLQEHLPPIDTVDALLTTASGAHGIFGMSFGSAFKDSTLEFTCEKGVVTLVGDTLTVNGTSTDVPFEGMGVMGEVKVFGETLANGKLDPRFGPNEALADLEVLESMFKSGEDGSKKTLELQY
ncbi:Gfo/Idh/MocA family protein [Aspergillus stella-maris]|uniref:Gfo/Idh/MocA family protein n=1 Tax=Aspergillus stella-maris TaxID=1810926 RepID=UPI003CCD1A9E